MTTGTLWRSTVSAGVQYARAVHRKGNRLDVDWTANRNKAALVDYADASAIIARAARDAGKPAYEAGAYGFTPTAGED